ncbi:MAG TPA: tetratricopeptide repeat protein, partial [Armatimonadota bacterium]|nr:tetratricopeptide repeat protein [Armatimonadota bacterium]
MSAPGGALPPDPALDRLLAEAFQRIRLDRYEEAAAKIAEAKALAPDHPAVLEMEGDLAFARRRYREAESLYRRAHALDPGNPRYEEKFATAILKIHEPELLLHDVPDDDVDFIWGQRRPR